MLTLCTPIPTIARGQVRALVKANAHWPAFLTEKAIISADARNTDLIEFALRHPTLTARIEQILGLQAVTPVKIAVAAYTVKIEALLSAYAARSKATAAAQLSKEARTALPAPPPALTTRKAAKRTSKAAKLDRRLPKAAEDPRKAAEDALNDFNYVGSYHHY